MVKKNRPTKQVTVAAAGNGDSTQIEQALRESEERYRQIFEQNQAIKLLIDPDTGQILKANQAAASFYGYSLETLQQFNISDINQLDPAEIATEMQAALSEQRNYFVFPHRLSSGEVRQVEVYSSPIDLSGKRLLYSIIHDITVRKQAEETLKESEEKYRVIFNNEIYSICIFDLETLRLLDVNDTYCNMYGYSREELVSGMTIHDITAEHQVSDAATRQAVNEGTIFIPLRYHSKKDGTVFPVEIVGGPYTWKGRKVMFALAHDITDRIRSVVEQKKTENEMRRLNERFDLATRAANMGVWDWDVARNDLTWDKQMYSLYGLKPENFSGAYEAWVKSIHPDDRERGDKESRQALLGDKEYDTEFRVVGPDGSIRHIKAKGDVFRDAEGKPLRMIGINYDITESKQAEEALLESRNKFGSILESLDDAIFLVNPATRVISECNDATIKIFGYSREEIIGKATDILHVDKVHFEKFGKDALTAYVDPGYYATEFEMRRKDGGVFPTENFVRPIRDAVGRILYVVSVVRDITERKKAEEKLRQSEERYRTISRLSSEFAYSCVHNGSDGYKVDWITNAFYTLTGYSEAELHEQGCWLFVSHPDDQEAAKGTLQGLRAGESVTQELRIVSRGGRILNIINYMECHIDPNAPGGLRLFGAVQDITDRKRLDEEQQRVEKLESVGLLAGGIAHDFNNILTAILGNISLASTEAAPGSDLRTSLEQAEKASLRAKDLTVQLLTFSRGGAPIKKLASAADMIRDTASFALRGSKVKCQFSIPLDLWQAEIDTGQISQIIHNLVINAKQAMPSGGTIELSAENIKLSKTQNLGKGLPLKEGDYVRIAVADHGTGIPKDHLEKIFDPFFSTKQEGSGLGLATSYSIARQHGGHLSVESRLGAGSTFYLYLPASKKTVTVQKDKRALIKPSEKARILVMDDEPGIRGIAGRLLKHIGYKDIGFAADGAEAIKLYKAAMKTDNPYAAVILDLTIPGGMGGEKNIRKLLVIDPHVKAIVSSGYIDDAVIAKYREYGFSGMVAKPYTIEELRKAVQDVIG